MKFNFKEYHKFTSLQKLLDYLDYHSKDDSRMVLLAGGTDLLIQLRNNKANNIIVLDISELSELKYIQTHEDTIRIGALTTHSSIIENNVIKKYAPILSNACQNIGSPQIRNRSTIGGNIINASPGADSIPPLICLDAWITLVSKNSYRKMPLSDIYLKPYQTNIEPTEVLTEICFYKLGTNYKYIFKKIGRRSAMSIARLSLAVLLRQGNNSEAKSNNIVDDIRIAPGSILPKPQRIKEAENILIGKAPTVAILEEVSEKVSDICISISGQRYSTPYKRPVLKSMVYRCLCILIMENWSHKNEND